MFNGLRRCLLAAILLIGGDWQVAARADSHTVLGLAIPVDQLSAVDESNFKVEIGGRSVIVARERLDDFLVQEVIGSSSSSGLFSTERLWSFIQRAAEAKLPEYVAVALRSWLLQQKNSTDAIALLREQLTNLEFLRGARFAVSSLPPAGGAAIDPEIVAWIILYAGQADAEWRRSKGVAVAFRYSKELKAVARSEIERELASGSEAVARQLLQTIEGFFGTEDSGAQDLALILTRASEINSKVAQGLFSDLYYLTDEERADRRFDFLQPRLIEGMHQRASADLKAEQPEDVLKLLAHIPFERRNETTHGLISEALRILSPGARSPLGDPAVGKQLSRMSEKDPQIRDLYIRALERQIASLVSERQISLSDPYLAQLIALRGDRSPANDEIREARALALAKAGQFDAARRELQLMSSGPSLWTRLSLIGIRLEEDPILLVILILIPAVLIVLWRGEIFSGLRRRFFPADRVAKNPHKTPLQSVEETEEESPEERPQGFRVLSKGQSLSPSMLEYQRLLQQFSLGGDADLASIKRAYRNAVKECHPDSNREQDTRASEEFIRVTKAYERLLELRIAQGLDR